MTTAVAQPIAGVSASRETEIEAVYPSVAGGLLGKLIGVIMNCATLLPFTPLRVIASLILGTLVLPLALLAYALTKLLGRYYLLTNRSVQARRMIGGHLIAQTALTDIAAISIVSQPGYRFHRVGDLRLENAGGNPLMTIAAIPYPERLRQVILDARNARIQSDASLTVIRGRI